VRRNMRYLVQCAHVPPESLPVWVKDLAETTRTKDTLLTPLTTT
jgi:hypothetical protein